MKKTCLSLVLLAITSCPVLAEDAKKPSHPVDHFSGIGRIEDFKAALPDENAGWEALHDKRFKDAVDKFRSATSKFANLPHAYMGMGTAFEKLGDMKEAESSYRSAIKLDTNNWRGYKRLANLLYQDQKYDEARRALADDASLKPPKKAQDQIDKMIQSIEAARKNGHADRTNLDDNDTGQEAD